MQEKLDTRFSSAVESLRNQAEPLSDKVRSSVGLLIQDIQQRVEQEPIGTVVPAVEFIESMNTAGADFIEKFSSFYTDASGEDRKQIVDDLVGSDREERMSGPLATFFLRNIGNILDSSDSSALIMQKSPSNLQH